MKEKSLWMILAGCHPPGRNTEQHDVFFGIGEDIKSLLPAINQWWPLAKGKLHIDAWRKVTNIDSYSISIQEKDSGTPAPAKNLDLFFINLGGYKENEFDEFHYKMIIVAKDLTEAMAKAKHSAFYKHHSVAKAANTNKAVAHIDDKFGVDIDDAYRLADILPAVFKEQYNIVIEESSKQLEEDELHLGYFQLKDFM